MSLPRTQERFSRLRIGGRECAEAGWRLEKIFVKITFLFESFQAGAQISDSVADAVEFFGIQLEGLTGERKWPTPRRNDPADGGDDDQRDDELENAHSGNPLGDPWLLHRDRVRRTSTMQAR